MACPRSGARRWHSCIGTSTASRASACASAAAWSARPRPRHLSTWFGHADLLHFVERCIAAPDVGFLTIWGVSANTRSWWDNSGAERLGYQPQQDAEAFADDVLSRPNPLDAVGQHYQGGSFASIDYDRGDIEPGRPAA